MSRHSHVAAQIDFAKVKHKHSVRPVVTRQQQIVQRRIIKDRATEAGKYAREKATPGSQAFWDAIAEYNKAHPLPKEFFPNVAAAR